MVDLSQPFADIENNLFEAEGYNTLSVWAKAKQAIDNGKSDPIDRRRYQGDSQKALSDLEEQGNKRIAVVWFMP